MCKGKSRATALPLNSSAATGCTSCLGFLERTRLCRFCLEGIETLEHALLLCTRSDEVTESRLRSFLVLTPLFPSVPLSHITAGNARWILKKLIFTGPTINLVAKFVWEILQIFGSTPFTFQTVQSWILRAAVASLWMLSLSLEPLTSLVIYSLKHGELVTCGCVG